MMMVQHFMSILLMIAIAVQMRYRAFFLSRFNHFNSGYKRGTGIVFNRVLCKGGMNEKKCWGSYFFFDTKYQVRLVPNEEK